VTPSGHPVPGKARGRLTKYTDELVDVVLDNGGVERCTPEHLWMLRSGDYKAARDLQPGIDRLGLNHKVRAVIPVRLQEAVPVYDLEVEEFSNFSLSSGVIVHNSKDVVDAVAGSVFRAYKRGGRIRFIGGANTYTEREE
jgi:hypothetical protein